MNTRFNHCGHCGAKYSPSAPWPRACGTCKQTTWRNPTPVGLAVIRTTSGGVLVIRRGFNPCAGQLAFAGGFQDFGEGPEEGVARELEEETKWQESAIRRGLKAEDLPRLTLSQFGSLPSSDRGTVLFFAVSDPIEDRFFEGLSPTEEATEILIVHKPIELCFSTHTRVLHAVLAGCLRLEEKWISPLYVSPRPA